VSEPRPAEPLRKIIHVDMDAFYASVEQRDDPLLRGRPVVVAWRGARSVVCAASYEARRFGVHSAMPALTAERLCPDAVFVPPDFSRYKAVSQQIRAIFLAHTDKVEPLSLDEAYLDVSENRQGIATATEIARRIKDEIREVTKLTASAGVAPNKFLAKIASDWRKPDGLFVIKPHQVLRFLTPLPVGKIPGVGKVTEEKLRRYSIRTVGELRLWERAELERHFGSFGHQLYQLARGIDRSEVRADRETRSISSEDTFEHDKTLAEVAPFLTECAKQAWQAARKLGRPARTVVIKLKTASFQLLTRSHTPGHPIETQEEFIAIALQLLRHIDVADDALFRLAGAGLSHFLEDEGDAPDSLFPRR
jgi:DNA polymerase-4